MIKVIIADDHKIMVDGIKSMLSDAEDDIKIVGYAYDGKEVLPLLKDREIDIAIIDIRMPNMDGIELTRYIKKHHPHIKILILSMHNEDGFIRRVIEAGADGYILKNKGKEELREAIEIINNGDSYFGDDIMKTIISGVRNNHVPDEIKLTKREIEVLKLIADGKTTPQISKQLFIAASTVETHRRNLIEKTGVENTKGLVKFAFQQGYY
jgi:DNA-binding NarL/FixJ family response regulator